MSWGPFEPYDGLTELTDEDIKWVLGVNVALAAVIGLVMWFVL